VEPAMARGGIDLGGTKIEAVILDDGERPVAQSRHPTPVEGGPPAIVEAIAGALREAAAAVGGVEGLAGVGIGSPGIVDTEAGTVSGAANLSDWAGTSPPGPK